MTADDEIDYEDLEMNEEAEAMMTGLVMEWRELVDALRPLLSLFQEALADPAMPVPPPSIMAAIERARALLDRIDAAEAAGKREMN